MELKMKLFLLILFVPLVLFGQTNDMPTSVQEKIYQAKDYYDLSLYVDSKKLLLELLHSEEGKNSEAEIRYHLGLASYYQENFNDAQIQWSQVIKKYPRHERSRELNRIMSNYISSTDENEMFREEEFEYNKYKELSFRFWTPIAINEKLFWGDLKNPEDALDFYKKLIRNYDDPNKKFQLLYYSFLISAGFNSNDYGYKNQNTLDFKHSNNVKGFINTMEKLITDEDDPNYGHLVQVYYLWGIKTSGSKLFSGGRVKINKESKPYFQKVIELTENKPTNIYRIFSEHWLDK